MSALLKKRWFKNLAYCAFFGFAFVLMLFVTFPFKQVADRIEAEAKAANIGLRIGAMGPSLFWIKAKNLALTPPKQEGSPEPQAIPIDEIQVRPTLLPLGVAFQAKLFGGTIEGNTGRPGKRAPLVVHIKNLDLSKTNSKAAVGLDLAGKLDSDVDLMLDPDGTKMSGKMSFNGTGMVINGGTVAQFDLPKVDLGRLEMAFKLDGGKATVDFFKTQGADVEATMDGDVTLAPKVPMSALKLKLKFKPAEEFLKRYSFIQTGLSFAMTKDSKGFYTVNINRVLGNPGFQPQR
ncbi:MAG TPA: type II secretion system protein GspN [Myxococcales bacterium]|jgi:type II secretion system protein N